MARTGDYDIRKAQRAYDDAADAYDTVRSQYNARIVRDDELLDAARRRMVNAEAALVAVARYV